MTFLLIYFKLDQKTQIGKCRWSEVPRIYAICVSIEHVHMHTYTYSPTHTLCSRIYTQWLFERETATCASVRELVRIHVRANRRFTQTRSIVLRGMRTKMCVYSRTYVCMSIHRVCVPPVGGFTVGTESRGESAQFSPFV